jgi:hypothetical protein
MKYLLLVHHNEENFREFPEATRKAMLAESVQLTHTLHAGGAYVSASPLHPASTAVTVKVREDKRFVTDGPYVETREQIAGYFMVEAESLEYAVEIAGRIPGARLGGVEVRQLLDIEGLPVIK